MSRKWEKVEGWYVTVAYICAQTTDLSAICYPGCHMSSEGAHEWRCQSRILPFYCALTGLTGGPRPEIHFTLNDFCLFMFVSMREM